MDEDQVAVAISHVDGNRVLAEAAQALLVEALTVLDPVERAPLIMEAADMLYSQYYAIPLGFQTAFSLRSDRVQDYSGVFWWFPVVGEGYNVWLAP